jgi:putative chitinase
MKMLGNPTKFFELMRTGLLGPELTQGEVNGCNAIMAAMEGTPVSWCAYALATAYRETASTMQPIKEYGGDSYFTRMYDINGARPKLAAAEGNIHPGDGIKFCGRGYVQLTWRANYTKAGGKVGCDLVNYPELAMNPDIAAKIMRVGMQEGWFTGKAFRDYLPLDGSRANRNQYMLARKIINGQDHALEIADHAIEFETALVAGGWH